MEAWDERSTCVASWLSWHEVLKTREPTPVDDEASCPPIADATAEHSYEASPPDSALSSNEGPPSITGSILDHPDLVWCEDTWTKEKEAEALERIQLQGKPVSDFNREKYDKKAQRFWDDFYKRNTTNFFKDRHYLHMVFPELLPAPPPSPSDASHQGTSTPVTHPTCIMDTTTIDSDEPLPSPHHTVLVEVGCGVGNAVLPLLEALPHLFIYGLDFSSKALDLLRQHHLYRTTRRARALQCDITKVDLPQALKQGGRQEGVDLCMLFFCLSAIAPEHMAAVAHRIYSALRPGGRLLFRDYGRYDEAQLRFKKGHKITDNFYVRSDGTCAYYFTVEDLRAIFVAGVGFVEVENRYIRTQCVNRATQAARYRCWIQGRFEKPNNNG